ncbi:MAG TPA: hypothetical protein VMT55_00540 [Candidatus Sulfotelmatobacter sp.]|nr:hypothetical protein [Candidatus Sulfotelmatobacter sp.]
MSSVQPCLPAGYSLQTCAFGAEKKAAAAQAAGQEGPEALRDGVYYTKALLTKNQGPTVTPADSVTISGPKNS